MSARQILILSNRVLLPAFLLAVGFRRARKFRDVFILHRAWLLPVSSNTNRPLIREVGTFEWGKFDRATVYRIRRILCWRTQPDDYINCCV